MVILLQVGSIEPGGHEVTFQDHFQESNADLYQRTISPRRDDLSHYRYLSGHVYPLSKDQRAAYVTAILDALYGTCR
jgi:hypothetical protein